MNNLYAKVIGRITTMTTSMINVSKIRPIIAPRSVAADSSSIFIPNWFSIPSVDGAIVEINSASLK